MTAMLAQQPRMDRAFERLYRRHVLDVYRYAVVVLRSREDAEDVTQTTFMNAYRAYQRGERPKSPRNWLIAIAHNVCRQRFRQAARRPQEVEFEDDHADEFVPDDDTPTAEDIRRALGHLAFNQRAALVMREIEGRSYAEIAEVLTMSVGAVETLIFRARRALREQLDGALTCHEAERAISRQLDGQLPRSERGALRAHLRECKECASFARSQRGQRSALRSFAMVPLPTSLASFFGGSAVGGGTIVAGGAVAKGAAVLATAMVATGLGYEGVKSSPWNRHAAKPTSRETSAAPAPTRTLPLSAVSAVFRAQPGAGSFAGGTGVRGGNGLALGRQGAPRGRPAVPPGLQRVPPGQAGRATVPGSRGRAVGRSRTPPGQSRRPAVPPGRAKRPPRKPNPAPVIPPGQLRKLNPTPPPPIAGSQNK